jgi:hypothetical protein
LSELTLGLTAVLQRFPDETDLIVGLAARSDTFRSLCEDYAVTRRALRCFEAAQDREHEAIAADYRNLTVELEHEIEEALGRAKAI